MAVPRGATCRLLASALGLASSAPTSGARLGGWRAHLLPCGGRLVLFKAILATIPIYYMSIFKMLVGVKRRLEKNM